MYSAGKEDFVYDLAHAIEPDRLGLRDVPGDDHSDASRLAAQLWFRVEQDFTHRTYLPSFMTKVSKGGLGFAAVDESTETPAEYRSIGGFSLLYSASLFL